MCNFLIYISVRVREEKEKDFVCGVELVKNIRQVILLNKFYRKASNLFEIMVK
ncbi:hypothetical protein RV14_GL000365 [Enterococcus ratti]|uniref:Uncharacterized protein n=1 Tax=Enterococcus ratti TaxID=150033 RepID=A0A1L8WII4_9ENTE|nr:hypothetical protein RV14_GL000365 [Enterococcus ratti]